MDRQVAKQPGPALIREMLRRPLHQTSGKARVERELHEVERKLSSVMVEF